MRCLTLIAVCAVALCLGGCKSEARRVTRAATGEEYHYAAQLLAMPSCQATVKSKEPDRATLRVKGGRALSLGGPNAAPEIWHFVKTLETGKTYPLPKAFIEFQQRSAGARKTETGRTLTATAATAAAPPTVRGARYEFTAQLMSMPSCRAVVDRKSPCVAYLTTLGDGRKLYIGSPGPSPAVGRFMGTLEIGKTYQLPDAFMDFLKIDVASRSGATDVGALDGTDDVYEFTAQLLAMPSCQVKVDCNDDCAAMLTTTDGQRKLIVGSPGASEAVDQFVQTLKPGQTYSLPDAFMKFQQQQAPAPAAINAIGK